MEEAHEHQRHHAEIDDGFLALRTLESAEGYVAGCTGTGTAGDGSGKAFTPAFKALLEWGVENQLILPESDFPFFKREPDGHGDEHQAWFDEDLNRWHKATYRDRFGLAWGRDGTATAKEYLSRLVLQNLHFGDDIRLIALINSGDHLRILTSQPHIAGEPAAYDEIQNWFQGLNFVRLGIDDRIAWYRREENLLVADAHEGNVIHTTKGDLVPIDLNIVQPSGELLDWALSLADY